MAARAVELLPQGHSRPQCFQPSAAQPCACRWMGRAAIWTSVCPTPSPQGPSVGFVCEVRSPNTAPIFKDLTGNLNTASELQIPHQESKYQPVIQGRLLEIRASCQKATYSTRIPNAWSEARGARLDICHILGHGESSFVTRMC